MTLTINGKEKTLHEALSVRALVDSLGLGEKRVAVEVNKELVVKQEWASRILREGDHVEVVTFVGGG